MTDPIVRRATFAGVGLVAFASLVLQVAYTRLYSAIFGNHFSFLAICLSLFGVGFGGVLVFLFPKFAEGKRVHVRLAVVSVAAGLASMLALNQVVGTKPIEKLNAEVLSSLSTLYAISSLPFVLTGLIIATALKYAASQVSRLYFFDMLGAAAGSAGALLLLRSGPMRAFLVGAILCACAAVAFALAASRNGSKSRVWLAVSVLPVALGLGLLIRDVSSPWLKLKYLRNGDPSNLDFQAWNEMCLVTVDKASPDLAHWLRMDSGAATPIYRADVTIPPHPATIGYAIQGSHGPVLSIGTGGGADITVALRNGQTDIDVAEINPITVNDVMRGRYSEWSGGLYSRPGVHVNVADGRSFVRRSPRHYRLIEISMVDTWAAASVGALSLTENSLYTVEAFEDYMQHLDDEGTLAVNRWDWEFERLLGLAAAGLHTVGVADPTGHLYACGVGRSTTLLVKRTPYSQEQIQALRSYCRDNHFYEAFAPDATQTPLRRALASLGDVRAADPKYETDLTPPTDNRPFFFYTVPPRDVFKWLRDYKRLEAQNQGLLSLVGMLIASLVVSVPLTVLPLLLLLFRKRNAEQRRTSAPRSLLFFTALGLGFVFVELALVQNFVMFLGHPVYALSTVLVALLAWTAVGSLRTEKIDAKSAGRAARFRALVLAGALVVAALVLGPALAVAVGLPLGVRIVLTIVLLAPLGLLMGSQAPLGIKVMEGGAPGLIPWSWGLNGLASVIATSLGTLVALHYGFSWLLLAGAVVYLGAAAVMPRLRDESASSPAATAE